MTEKSFSPWDGINLGIAVLGLAVSVIFGTVTVQNDQKLCH